MTDPTDIVTRLRLTPVLMYGDELNQNRIDYEACKKYINNEGVKMMREAADEIERLRKELDARIAMCDMRSEKIGELANERDEARREVCDLKTFNFDDTITAYCYADLRKWDCFKKKTLKDCLKENANG
jgi:hypothetical protein